MPSSKEDKRRVPGISHIELARYTVAASLAINHKEFCKQNDERKESRGRNAAFGMETFDSKFNEAVADNLDAGVSPEEARAIAEQAWSTGASQADVLEAATLEMLRQTLSSGSGVGGGNASGTTGAASGGSGGGAAKVRTLDILKPIPTRFFLSLLSSRLLWCVVSFKMSSVCKLKELCGKCLRVLISVRLLGMWCCQGHGIVLRVVLRCNVSA